MPAQLLDDPLGIDCLFSDGGRARCVIEGADPVVLVGDLLAGLAEMVHPHGMVDSPGTVGAYFVGLRDMAAFMRERGRRGGADASTRGSLGEASIYCNTGRETSGRG